MTFPSEDEILYSVPEVSTISTSSGTIARISDIFLETSVLFMPSSSWIGSEIPNWS